MKRLIDDSNCEALCTQILNNWEAISSADYGEEIELNPFWTVNIHTEGGMLDLMWTGADRSEWELAAAILTEGTEEGMKIILEIQ